MPHDSPGKDPEKLRRERPPYVTDTSGPEDENADAAPAVGTDPADVSGAGGDRAEVHLDPDAVRRAEREGKGFR
jgi:hypothetical protein